MTSPGGFLRSLRRRLFDGLLGVPVSYILGGALLGVLVLPVSQALDAGPDLATVDVARSVLPAIGGATLSLAGFVLTITTLGLQLGASTYAPRMIDQLRRDPMLRHTLGSALGTFTFAVVVLLAMRSSHPAAATPATLLAIAGAIATVLLFITLLERLIGSLRPGAVMGRLTRTAMDLAITAYPQEATGTGPAASPEEGGGDLPDAAVVEHGAVAGPGAVWRRARGGCVIDIDARSLVAAARQHGLCLTLTLPVGAYLQAEEIVAVALDAGTGLPRPVDDAVTDAVVGALEIGDDRTTHADPSLPLRLVVDVALRALSPGVNDPTTASQAIEHVEQVLLTLAGRRLGTQTMRDEDGVVRLRVPAPGWEALVDLGYRELVAAGSDPQTRRALSRSLLRLAARVPGERRAAVERIASSVHPGDAAP